MSARLLVYLAAVTAVGAVLDGSKVYRPTRTRLKTSSKAHYLELPSGLVNQFKSSGPGGDVHIPVQTILTSSRSKRDDKTCGFDANIELEISPMDLAESAEAIQAVWTGKDEILIVASDKSTSGQSNVWIGELIKSVGVFRFKQDSSSITTTAYPDSLQVSPVTPRSLVVVVSYDRRFLYVSRDYGKTWTKYETPSANFDPAEELHLSNSNPLHMVLLDRDGKLYATYNGGINWNMVTRNVQLVEFGDESSGSSADFVYYSTASVSSSHYPLYRMDMYTKQEVVIDSRAYRFRVDSKYLFVSRKNVTGNKALDDRSRRLYVSQTYTAKNVQFTEVQLPSLNDQQFYVVMATHEMGAFIHVFDGENTKYGKLYVSDSSGSRFTLSLNSHLYEVHYQMMGHYSVHDFYEVASARGVYITSSVNSDLGGHVTMITFNNGGQWQRLSVQGACSDCSLHLYLRYSRLVAPLYNMSSATEPLTIESAPGIIIAHGNVGKVRNNNQVQRVFISKDGGFSWKDSGVPEGTYVYGIADYGNIIAIAKDTEHVEHIWISHDRGDCFLQRTLDSTSVFQLSRGLLVDPSAGSLYAFVMGVEGTGEKDEWKVIALNFRSVLTRQCTPSDYQLYTEHEQATSCLMGFKVQYNITKEGAICYNEQSYNYKPVQQTKCFCDYSDYECDYGFNRSSINSCTAVPGMDLSTVCPQGHTTYMQSDSGFRLIPGDLCKSTSESKRILKQVEKVCTAHEKDAGFYPENRRGGSIGWKVFGAFVIVVAALATAAFTLYCWLRCQRNKLAREKVYYQRVPLNDTGTKFSANEDTSSDEELIAAS